MSEQDYYYTIEKTATAEYKDRGSKFIAYAFPVEVINDFRQRLGELKKEHPKAVHHCFAYRIGLDGNTFRVSDDGEPSGTGGKPILGQIDSRQLTNVAIIVVRYFGGTLLGVPGLINAYKTSSSMALQVTPVVQKQVEVLYKLQFDYTQMNEVMMIIKQTNCRVIKRELQLFCVVDIGMPKSNMEICQLKFSNIRGLRLEKK